jgi:hypothetical protein
VPVPAWNVEARDDCHVVADDQDQYFVGNLDAVLGL